MELHTLKILCFHLSLLILVASSSVIEASHSSSLSSSDAETVSRFQHYLQINTSQPIPNYHQVADFLISQAKSISLESQAIEFVQGKPFVLIQWLGTNPNLPSILLYSHTDVVPSEPEKWKYDPFSAHVDQNGNIYARGSQDMKCVGMQYLEAVRRLKASSFQPLRSIYLAFSPDEEIGGQDGAAKFVESEVFKSLNIGVVLDEGLASPEENYRIFYSERISRKISITATGEPGHGSRLYDNSAAENLMKSLETIRRFRASQFDMIKAGLKKEGEVVSVNMVYSKAGTPSPTGFVMNVQPSKAEAGFDIRVPPTADIELLERRIADEWAPASRNMTFQFGRKGPVHDVFGNPLITKTNSSNPWWGLLKDAIQRAGGKLQQPEIFPASSDARFFRQLGLPAFGFSPMENTPILLHDHNEFLNQEVYLKGITMYESLIRAYASYEGINADSKDEL
ncbi:hypothetical protein K1719_033048 [Acacia pycnantha]|nr:hypothetical protein K1719_033048 [Acacia pycnantha]